MAFGLAVSWNRSSWIVSDDPAYGMPSPAEMLPISTHHDLDILAAVASMSDPALLERVQNQMETTFETIRSC